MGRESAWRTGDGGRAVRFEEGEGELEGAGAEACTDAASAWAGNSCRAALAAWAAALEAATISAGAAANRETAQPQRKAAASAMMRTKNFTLDGQTFDTMKDMKSRKAYRFFMTFMFFMVGREHARKKEASGDGTHWP